MVQEFRAFRRAGGEPVAIEYGTMQANRVRRALMLLGTSALVIVLADMSHAAESQAPLSILIAAAESERHAFDLPAQPLNTAIQHFGRQAGLMVTVDAALPEGLTSAAVRGQMSSAEALRQLLQDTGLTARFRQDGGVVVERTGARQSYIQLDAVSVVADRTERPIGETSATVSVIDSTRIEDRNIHRMQDLVADEPGVTVSNDPHRAGAGGYNIRGIDDNRILMMVDGMKLPDLPGGVLLRGGGFTPYTRDMVDMDSLKRVEILRGPASALYGSDALGGVVAYVTKNPEDYLRPGKDAYGSLKVGFDSMDESWSETGTAAMRVGDFSALALYTRRDGEEVKTEYKGRNPQEYQGNNLLGKLVYDHGADRVGLTGEYFHRAYESEMYGSRTATYPDVDGDDETKRWRLSLEHTHDAPVGFIDKLGWKLYYTKVDREEDRVRQRTSGYEDYLQTSEQDIIGGDMQFNSQTRWGGVENRLTYGLSLDYTKSERLRRYARYDAAGTLISTVTPDGAPTPSRFFPNTSTFQGGIFGQDEIVLGAASVTPGLRFDYYRLKPDPDAYYLSNPSTRQAKEIEEFALSPKLGLVYRLDPVYSLYGQYAHGFRAPPYDDANTGFSNSVGGGMIQYEFLPNPDLEAETSNGVEAGFRGRFQDGSSFNLSSFFTRYKNYIDMKTIVAPTVGVLGQYQAVNLRAAEIYGAEASGLWRFMPEWGLSGSAAYAEGENKETGRPIDSVAPLTLQAGLAYDSSDAVWGAGANARHAFKHTKVSDDDYYRTKSYTVVDLNAYYTPADWLILRAGINNLFDARYINFADVERLIPGAGDSAVEGFIASGRTFNVSATIQW
jgi:TonB-dependent heme/hemoglobin receptor family protein/TonB-dependent hemoglobin/transferrin/lactoferrin receptor family protein